MYTREEFNRLCADADRIERREGRALALASVGLGLAQLPLIRWTDAHLARPERLYLEGGIFLAYAALVAFLLWRLVSRTLAAHPVCPACGAVLRTISERVARATGHCDRCGAQVIA